MVLVVPYDVGVQIQFLVSVGVWFLETSGHTESVARETLVLWDWGQDSLPASSTLSKAAETFKMIPTRVEQFKWLWEASESWQTKGQGEGAKWGG